MAVAVQDERFELDPWLSLGSGDADGAWPAMSVALDTRQLLAQGRVLHQVRRSCNPATAIGKARSARKSWPASCTGKTGAHKLSAKGYRG